ncbi:MAG TPA: aryl-sulfate sulfotransferase, partial [Bacteroidia bacterium]|nr:aryl-sulfate sulfotransferase [Bacteroidia bacterium]
IYDSSVTGYYFLVTRQLGDVLMGDPTQLILNEKGEAVYYKPFANNPPSTDFKLQPNGMISYFRGTKYFLLDSTFTRVDSVNCIGYNTDAHDMQILGNGHYLLLGIEYSTMDLSTYNYFNNNGTPGSSNATVSSDLIQELDANKNVVFEWHSFAHFQFDDVDEFWLHDPNYVDWTHSNSIEMDTDGNILVSIRHFNEITKIDHATGNILWRLGGKENEFTFLNDSLTFRGQHDIRRIANGNITLFDNGNHTIPHGARGVEYALDEVNKTADLVWSYTRDPNMTSYATGNNQRVSESRKIINYGNRGEGSICFTFIDSLDNPISELSFTDSAGSYRVFFYPSLPWNLKRPQVICYQQLNDFYLTTITSHTSYLWSTGATTATIQVTATGTYHVYVPYGEGFIKSENFEVISTGNPCSTISVQETGLNSNDIFLYPNPASSSLTIHYPLTGEKVYELKIVDVTGKLVFKDNLPPTGKYVLHTGIFERGIYFLRIGNLAAKFFRD